MTIPLSKTGEVADFSEADQFQTGDSQFECGYFACAMAKSIAQVGQAPTLTAAQIISDAETWYAQYDGTDAITNVDGMTTEQEYDLLSQIGLHYQAIGLDIATVMAWVELGYPVLVAVVETSVVDLALNSNPYPWTPAGTHVLLVTGVVSGNILVRDSANCTSLNDPNSLRPGPRTYNAAKIQLVSATIAVPPWLPRPGSAVPPTTGEETMLTITTPTVADWFEEIDANHWKCKSTGFLVQGNNLAFYCQMKSGNATELAGLTMLGLPLSNEVAIVAGAIETVQSYERGIIRYDPTHQYDNPPGAGRSYQIHLSTPLSTPVDITTVEADANAIIDALPPLFAKLMVDLKKLV
jgi:hypothetical protein